VWEKVSAALYLKTSLTFSFYIQSMKVIEYIKHHIMYIDKPLLKNS